MSVHVKCAKCRQRRTAKTRDARYIWFENRVCLFKDDRGKWECQNGFGCSKQEQLQNK